MKRLHWHWTAGAPGINPKEADSYNFVITWPDGEIIECVPVERQKPPLINGAYAAHTLSANSDAIGIAVDGMAGAQERPFKPGSYPITKKQIDSLVRLSAKLGREYRIPVTRETMLSHAEVQPTLGIKQNNKWDIMWIPGMSNPGDPVEVGDILREAVKEAMIEGTDMTEKNLFSEDFEPKLTVKTPPNVPVLALGSEGEAVRALQARLRELRYFSGAIDGKFGPRTQGAVTEYQTDNGLIIDGKVGRQTRESLATAVPRALRNVTKEDLVESRTMQEAQKGKNATAATTGLIAVSAGVGAAEQVIDVGQRAGGLVQGLIQSGPMLLIAIAALVGGFLIWKHLTKVEDIRLDDAQTGANDSR